MTPLRPVAEKSMRKMLARAGPILARLPRNRVQIMVEVGVDRGLMGEYLLRERPLLQWYGVDNWAPADRQPEAYKRTGDVHATLTPVQAEFTMREARARTVEQFPGRAELHHEASPLAAARFADQSVDLVFVDARHDYEGCLADLRGWWSKVRAGGLLAGHDFGNPDPRFLYGVNQAVNEFASELDVTFEADEGYTYFMRRPA